MSRVLFFNAPVRKNVYFGTNVKIGTPNYPHLTFATLAGNLKNHQVKILDLDLISNYQEFLDLTIKKFKPDYIASTAKTTEYLAVKDIMIKIKENFPSSVTIIGGPHISAFPEEIARESCFDIVVIGEGDYVLPEILSKTSLKDVSGIIYKEEESKKLHYTGKRDLIKDINQLPYPAWNLFDLTKYSNSRLSSRKNPVGHIETSRGCAYQCNFCNKLTFGTLFRVKEPKRVVDEMEYMLKCGFKEIHITDDSFTQNMPRAKEVCREIIRRGLKFPWSLINGVRVNLVDEEFFRLAKKAGCWQVGLGIETGSQRVLNRINKKITLEQVSRAVKLADKIGLDTFGFFIFGLAGETEKSMEKTLQFSKSLPLTTAKFDVCIPYPGTKYYSELEAAGRIRSYDWSRYNVHQTENPVYDHPNLSWDRISYYYQRSFKEFYFRPEYIMKRLVRSFKKGDLFYDFIYFLKFLFA